MTYLDEYVHAIQNDDLIVSQELINTRKIDSRNPGYNVKNPPTLACWDGIFPDCL